MKNFKIVVTAFLLLLFVTPFSEVRAEKQVGYSVEAVLPENQLDDSLSYFNLRMKESEQQELTVNVYNHENEDITIRTRVHNASTNSNGIVVYEEESEPQTKNPVTELVTVKNEEVIIPAGESKPIMFRLQMPAEPFEGVKLGGLYFEKVQDEGQHQEGVSIQNNYAYVIGLQLSQDDKLVEPALELENIEPTLVNYRTAIVAQIHNTQPMILDEVAIQAKIYNADKSELITEVSQEGVQFAPNSTMDFVMDWNNQALKEGEYHLELLATKGEKSWEWQESFVIQKEDEAINEEAVELKNENTLKRSGWYNIGMIALVAVIFGLIMYIRKLKKAS